MVKVHLAIKLVHKHPTFNNVVMFLLSLMPIFNELYPNDFCRNFVKYRLQLQLQLHFILHLQFWNYNINIKKKRKRYIYKN